MSLAHEATSLLQRLIRLDTVNPPGNELPAQELLRTELEETGFECELLGAIPERPNLIARLPGRGDGPRLCFLGHVDTVLADPAEWTVDPWSGELRDGNVWGRGALDMKGQVACEVAAACDLARSGWRPPAGELMLVLTCDEEAGATYGARWLCESVPDKVRCDMIVNEGAGEGFSFGDRSVYTVCIGEKGVFRFRLTTEGRAGHASMPGIGDNALLRMVEVLGRLDGRQPAFDSYPEARSCLELLVGDASHGIAPALDRVRAIEPRLADQLEPVMRVTVAPTMIRASLKENVIPSRCTVQVDCRVPPRMGADHVRRRVEELIGPEGEGGYRLEFSDEIVGSSSALEGELADAIRRVVDLIDADATLLPLVLPGFTDSHWFRKAFPDCVAYGFFPQRTMSFFDTAPLIHAPDERIAVADLELAARSFQVLSLDVLA
jgi:acetylornithine deacetylase/succinyl-diaminopimelate desuccinylase-like protein